MSLPWPSNEQGLSLHRRLCDGDVLAPSDFAEAYVNLLFTWLREKNPRADEHRCLEAVHQTIVGLILRPDAFDPAQCELAPYLRMSARGDLLNLLRGEDRRQRGRVPLENVEEDPSAGKYSEGEDDPAAVAVHAEESRRRAAFLDDVRNRLSESDRRVFDLMREGGRGTGEIAEALGLSDRPPREQEREVKRAKDRIGKRIKRAGGAP